MSNKNTLLVTVPALVLGFLVTHAALALEPREEPSLSTATLGADVDLTRTLYLHATRVLGRTDLTLKQTSTTEDGLLLITPSDGSFDEVILGGGGMGYALEAIGFVRAPAGAKLLGLMACFHSLSGRPDDVLASFTVYKSTRGIPGDPLLRISAEPHPVVFGGGFLDNCVVEPFDQPKLFPARLYVGVDFGSIEEIGLLADTRGRQEWLFTLGASCSSESVCTSHWEPLTKVRGLALFAIYESPSPGGGDEPTDGGSTEPCTEDLDRGVLCLREGRFELSMQWAGSDRATSPVVWQYQTDEVGLGVFQNNPGDVTVVVKVTNGCPINGRHWVWLAGLTDARLLLTVRDTDTGTTRSYRKPLGELMTTVRDDSTFPCD